MFSSSLKAGMTTESDGESVGESVGESTGESAGETAEWEGLGVRLDEYSAWYKSVFPVFWRSSP
jgi:hypothetical protein